MAGKRKAQEAFGKPNGTLSAFAAAKQAKQRAQQPAPKSDSEENNIELASTIAGAPYDGHHDASSIPAPEPEVEVSVATPTPPKPSVRLSNFTRNKNNPKVSDDRVELSLKADEYVTFVGEYDLEVSKGVVSIQGAMLHSSSGKQRVYALSTQAMPAIVARKDSAVKISAPGSESEDFLVQTLERLSPLFSNIGARHKHSAKSFALLVNSSDDPLQRPLVPLEVDDDTKRVLSRLNARLDSNDRAPRIMAVGAKSSGKSTFNRLACNMIVTRPAQQRCFYLDLDPGQPEFGPPGQVSLVEVTAPLLGPAYTHPASIESKAFRLVRTHTIAATSFKDDPGHYVSCAIDLVKRIPDDVPVIVNSCGWVSGLGASVLLDILAYAGGSDTVVLGQLDSSLEEAIQTRATIHKVARRQGLRTIARTPAELRAMQTMAYFHQRNTTSKGPTRWNCKRMGNMRPWIVGYSSQNAGIEAILSYGQAPQPDFLSEVLDGSIVAIVKHDPNLFDEGSVDRTANEDMPYIISKQDGFSFPIDPQQSQCLGLALIRGIDIKSKKLHLVTPLPESQIADLMQQKVLIIRGGFDSPEWAYLEDPYAADKEEPGALATANDRPWVTLREPVGVEGSVWRLRYPPTRDSLR